MIPILLLVVLVLIVGMLAGRIFKIDHYEKRIAEMKKDADYWRDVNTRTPGPPWPPHRPPHLPTKGEFP
jgi:hypothetical protein